MPLYKIMHDITRKRICALLEKKERKKKSYKATFGVLWTNLEPVLSEGY